MTSPEEMADHSEQLFNKLKVEIDALRRMQNDTMNGELGGEERRLIALAITDLESAQNWLVRLDYSMKD